MKTAFAIAAALVLGVPALAQADGAAEAEAAHRGELSQINGMPVPVGDHNQYFYGYPRFNVGVNPIGLMLGAYGISGSYAITDHFVLRGELDYYDFADDYSDTTGIEFDVGVPIYFRRAYQGIFVEPGFMYRRMESDGYDPVSGNDARIATTEMGPQVLLGYHWTWDSGFNVAIAAGVGRDLQSDEGEYEDDEADIFANGYLRVGYAF
jgi:hypothetical protein